MSSRSISARPTARRSRVGGPVVLIGLALAACANSGVEAARAEIEAVTRVWEASLLAGSPEEAVPEVFTVDAVRLPSGEAPVRGRDAIVRALAGSAPLVEAAFEIQDIEVHGALAFANGVYRVRAAEGPPLEGKFLEVWKRTDVGWRIHRVMWD